MIATITLNPSIDQIITVRKLTKDDANRALGIERYPGGKGLNVSKAVRELGGATRAYAVVGGCIGSFWQKRVEELDIPFDIFPVRGETRINTILTDLSDKTQTRVSAPGPRVTAKEIRGFLRKLLTVRPRPFAWALGGSLAQGMPPHTYRDYIFALQKGGVFCVLDADDDALKKGVQAKPFLIKPNEHEIERLFGQKFRTLCGYDRAAKALVKKGITIVVVSLGKKGALFVTKYDSFHIPAIAVPTKSKVGAGDSLIGGLLLGLYRRMPLRRAALLGMAASHSAVMREAPRLCLKSDIPGLLRRLEKNS